tara:strand:- start:2997 stop:3314 length:318 start_codon:yes stop_codon:yes gene_type:complete
MAVKYTMEDYEYLVGEGGDIHVYVGPSQAIEFKDMPWKKLTKSTAKNEFRKYLPPVDELWLEYTKEAKAVYEAIRDEHVEGIGNIGMLYYKFDNGIESKVFRVTP